jgi:hypothetical protein
MPGQTKLVRRTAAAAIALLVLTGMASAGSRRAQSPGVIYAAFSITKQGRAASKRCGPYTVRAGTFTGISASPDVRLAGRATLVLRIAVDQRTGLGFTRGSVKIRDGARRLRLSASLQGVNTTGTTVNGIVAGNVYGPNALLLANVTIVFNENFTGGVVRLGLEDGHNSGVAYSPLPGRCT